MSLPATPLGATTLGVVGLGSMGRGAALSALKRGVPTWGFDLNPTACATVAEAGGRIATSVADLAAHCDAVVVLVVNAAQTEQVLFGEGGDDLLKYSGAHNLPKPLRPFFVVPTTSGTGSEVTMVAVVADSDKGVKLPFTSYYLMPNAAILDSRMTLTLPPHITAMTGMDALTHAVEAFTCMAHNPMSDAYATAAISKISQNLMKVMEDPKDADGRLELAQASTMAGAAFSNSTVT